MPGSTRSAQPTASAWYMVIARTALGSLGERPDAGGGCGLVAGDERAAPIGLGLGALLVRRRRPRLGDPAGVRRRRQVEGAAAGLALPAERVRELRQARAAAAAAARPDQDGALGLAQPAAELAAGLRELAAGRRRAARGVRTDPAGAVGDDLGAVALRGLASARGRRSARAPRPGRRRPRPRAGRRRSRRAAGGRRRAPSEVASGSTASCESEPFAKQLREPVGLLDRLGARRARRRSGRRAPRSSFSASSTARSQATGSKPRRRTRRSGSTMRSAA